MRFIDLRLLWVPISLMSLVQQIAGQFKIVNFDTANLTYPSIGTTRSVNFVEIKPIVIANSSAFTELSTRSTNQSSRALQQERLPTMMIENKFIKLSIVNSTTIGSNKTRERKIQEQAITSARQNELASEIWSKTHHRPLSNTKLATVVGYAKKSKIRTTTQTEMDPAKKSAPESSKLRRNMYRNFKSRCRCERIWNCARIQISVARCAPDFFMCCF